MKHARWGCLALILALVCLAVAMPAAAKNKKAPAPASPPHAAAATKCPKTPDTFGAVFWPVQGRLISVFGALRNGERNAGIDLAVPEGTAVRAIAAGIVIYAGNELEGYGYLALLRHAEGWVSGYAHNKALSVTRGDTVCAGQTIALSGATGQVAEPELHFELRQGATPVDPLTYLPGDPPAVDIAEQIPAPDAKTEPMATPPPAAPEPTACPRLPDTFAAVVWPVRGRIIAPYGTAPNGGANNGIDLAVPAGTPVQTIADGTVIYAGDAVEGYGNLLLVRHADGWVSAYANNAAFLVVRGQTVCAGQAIARSGATGTVTEPQLHFELRKGARPVNPVDYLPK